MFKIILKQKILRIIFFGTTNFSAYHLHALICSPLYQIQAIFTQAHKKSTKKISYNFIEKIAKIHKIKLFRSNEISMIEIARIIKKLNTDLIIVVSYGLLLPKEILEIPKLGCINLHASLLPRWRGAAPIQRALEYGDTITGISIIKMDTGIDTGNILYKIPCNILPTDTSYSLSNKLSKIGVIALFHTLEKLVYGICNDIPQNEIYATYAQKLYKKEAHINWKLPAIQIERQTRAFNPWPVSFFYINKHRIRIWKATTYNITDKETSQSLLHMSPGTILQANSSGLFVSTGHGILKIITLQIEGKKITSISDILHAYKSWFIPNTHLI